MTHRFCRWLGNWLVLSIAALLVLAAAPAAAQSRQDKGGITLYWGLVPEGVLARRHPGEDLHGGAPRGGGQVHHLVVAIFDTASGRRIDDALVRARLSEVGVVDEAPKYLAPMKVNDLASYGQLFAVAKEGPYRFKLWVRLPQRTDEIEIEFTAASPHGGER